MIVLIERKEKRRILKILRGSSHLLSLTARLSMIVAVLGVATGLFSSVYGGLAGIPSAFVDIGYGARPMGMGGAYVALADDINTILWNPAGLTRLAGREITFMYADQMGLVPYYFAAYGQSFWQNHAHGEAIIHSGDEVLSETTLLAAYGYTPEGVLGPPLDRLRLGATFKVRLSSFGDNSDGGEERSRGDGFGFGLDLGAQWRATDKLILGVLARDILNTVSYNNEARGEKYSESVPSSLVLGLSTSASERLLFALDLEKSLYADTDDIIHFGAEWILLDPLTLRVGFSQNIGPEIYRSYSLGLGVRHDFRVGMGFRFDFAYIFNEVRDTSRVSTTLIF
ncbi:MAG TPA: hypothetical protein EYP53_04585 [Candidatus Latescibacteria bacterium]|nr:hypothetical protein [Candidatus Latescibacterota bacterium]